MFYGSAQAGHIPESSVRVAMVRPRGRAPPARAGPPPTHHTLLYNLEPTPGFQCLPGRAASLRPVAAQLAGAPPTQHTLLYTPTQGFDACLVGQRVGA